jgi:hypothetical protein
MSRLLQSVFCLLLAGLFLARAQTAPFPAASQNSSAANPPPERSPVTFFRELLAMPPAERERALTNRPPESRARILAKVDEYAALDPGERELRLRATELRWWLTPLLRAPRAERAARLAQVPADLRDLVRARLMQWDILPPPLQEEFLAHERTLHYFAQVSPPEPPPVTPEQRRVAAQVNRFFELTDEEKEQTLNALTPAERAAMQGTLQAFDKLTPQQRSVCVRNYAKFAGMSAAERAEFLKNAERWSQMSPEERQTWRDLVAQVPIWPPMPPPMIPQMLYPKPPPPLPQPTVATNAN